MAAFAAALIVTTGAAIIDSWILAEIAYAALFVLLIQFALRRFLAGEAGRRPPAAFVLLPIAALQGLAGAALIAAADANAVLPSTGYLGVLLVEQGVFLCLAIGVGSLVLPLMGGAPPPTRPWLRAPRNLEGTGICGCRHCDLLELAARTAWL